MPNYLQEICKNCGLTYGSHHAGTSPYPRDYCPGHENRMDWDKGPGTCFKSTGKFKDDGLEKPCPEIRMGLKL